LRVWELNEGWTVTALCGAAPEGLLGQAVPASVPGCVSTDLMAARLLPDPYLGMNEELHGWVGRTAWRYRTVFDNEQPGPSERVSLIFEGLDTAATIKLNERVIAHTANMHRSYRFDVTELLQPGSNTVLVDFEAPVDYAETMSKALGPRPHVQAHPFNAVRKMACNFGWDWGPDLPTVGIWRPVRLERWQVARIHSVRPVIRAHLPDVGPGGPLAAQGTAAEHRSSALAHGGGARAADATSPRRAPATVTFNVQLERATGQEGITLELRVTVAGAGVARTVGPGEQEAVVEVEVPEAELWWPAGYGAQPLYSAEVLLQDGAGNQLDAWGRRTGFRSVELDTREDDRGCRLGFVVNGRAIQVRGANWIPDDCFPSRVSAARYRRRLQDARAANMNLLRVWGGGIYEAEEFYESADELGLLVWQDFCFACAAYAEEEPLRGEVEAEAREAVTRLAAHPSLAVWCGCNENLWGYEDWGWKERLDGRSWGAGYYYELLPAVVAELDPTRPYMAGSPWSLGHNAHPNDPRHGSAHVWDVWNQKDYSAYRDWQPQFVTEFGFQGPPAWSTLLRALGEGELTKQSPVLAAHEKAIDGLAKLDRWLAAHFPEPASFEDWHWATSLNQARAVALAVEYWRSLEPRCRGTVVWQLNDCWPVISWAAVDGDGRKKPLWYALRRAYADRLLTVQPTSQAGGLDVVAVNDSLRPWHLELSVTRQGFTGEVLAECHAELSAGPGERARFTVGGEVASASDPAREVLVASGGGHRALWWFAEDKDLALPEPVLSVEVEPVAGGFDVLVGAPLLQRDVALLADKANPLAETEDMLVTLLAGESCRMRVSCPEPLDPEALRSPAVLRSANQLVHASERRR
jgi:beta-mannosidase